MRYHVFALSLWLAGCSFIDDFGSFRVASSDVQTDASAIGDGSNDTSDGGTGSARDGGASVDAGLGDGGGRVDCSDAEGGAPCGGSGAGAECTDGQAPSCVDSDPCTQDGQCRPTQGCVFELIDADRDGYAPATCAQGSTQRGDDCDDANPSVHPGATEYCDGIDNDCDDTQDESAVAATCYPDADGDGFPVEQAPLTSCVCAQGTMPARLDKLWDCWDDNDDAGRDVFPGQTRSFELGYDARCASPSGPCTVIKRYDYDCDGAETPLYTRENISSCGALGGALGCSPSGYTDQAPACGVSASYLSCEPNGGLLGGCSSDKADRIQPCR